MQVYYDIVIRGGHMKAYSMRKKVRFGFVVAAIVLGICLLWFGIDAYVHPNTTYLPVSEKTGYLFTLPDTQNPTCVPVDITARKVHYFFHNGEECCLRLSTENEYVFGWTGSGDPAESPGRISGISKLDRAGKR
jgi:hypothetical protein